MDMAASLGLVRIQPADCNLQWECMIGLHGALLAKKTTIRLAGMPLVGAGVVG